MTVGWSMVSTIMVYRCGVPHMIFVLDSLVVCVFQLAHNQCLPDHVFDRLGCRLIGPSCLYLSDILPSKDCFRNALSVIDT